RRRRPEDLRGPGRLRREGGGPLRGRARRDRRRGPWPRRDQEGRREGRPGGGGRRLRPQVGAAEEEPRRRGRRMIERIVGAALASRVGALAAAVLLVVAGGWALGRLPIDAMPDVTTVQVQILTLAPELGALEVEQLITRPVESVLGGIPRVQEIRSISRYGVSNVTIVFE